MTAPLRQALTGIVLAGGAGRRFGSDKPSASFAGTTLLAATVARVIPVVGRCLVVGKDDDRLTTALRGLPARIVRDGDPSTHPLAGFVAGLRAIRTPWALIVSCDAPLLQAGLVGALMAAATDDVDAVVARWDDHVQPLPGLYRAAPAVIDEASRLLAASGSLRALVKNLRARVLSEDDARAGDPSGRSFADADTPAALAALERLAAAGP